MKQVLDTLFSPYKLNYHLCSVCEIWEDYSFTMLMQLGTIPIVLSKAFALPLSGCGMCLAACM